jgi:hypothetical protein
MLREMFDVLGMDSTSLYTKHNDVGELLMPITTRPEPNASLHDGHAKDLILTQPLDPEEELGGVGLFGSTVQTPTLLQPLLRDDGPLLNSGSISLVSTPCLFSSAQDALNETLSVPIYAATMVAGEPVLGTPSAGRWSYALDGIVALDDSNDSGLMASTLHWGGAPNLKWWIIRGGGTVIRL